MVLVSMLGKGGSVYHPHPFKKLIEKVYEKIGCFWICESELDAPFARNKRYVSMADVCCGGFSVMAGNLTKAVVTRKTKDFLIVFLSFSETFIRLA